MADFDTTLRSYNGLRKAAEREKDPERRKWFEEQASQLFASLQSVPDIERGDVGPIAAPPVAPPLSSFTKNLEIPGQPTEAPPPSTPKGVAASAPAVPAFDAQRDAYFRRVAAEQGVELPQGFLSAKPDVSSVQNDVAQAVQPTSAPQQSGAQPLSLDEFMARFGRGRGGPSLGQLAGAAQGLGAATTAREAAEKAQRDAVLAKGQAEEDAGAQLGRTMASFATEMKARDEEHQARLQQQRQRIGGLLDESRAAAEEFKAATQQQGLMESFSTGGRIGAAISLALGAIGGGLTGQGGNAALDVLKFRVDEDLRNRQLNIAAKGQALDAVDGLLQRNMQIFDDETSARAATRAAVFDALKLEVQRQGAISGGVDANNAAKLFAASLDAERARSQEQLAQQQLLALQKAARSGGGPNDLKLLQAWQQYLKNDVGVQTDAEKLDAMRRASGDPSADLGSEEGARAAVRKNRVAGVLEPIDTALDYANTLLSKGVPSVATRAAYAVGAPLPVENVEQMSALGALTRNTIKAIESGRLSDQDAIAAKKELLIQGPLTSQEALTRQIRTLVDILQRSRTRAESIDAPASAAYEAEIKKRGGGSSEPKGSGVPSYSY